LVQICWKDPRGRRRRTSALLEDISVSGACLQTEVPIPVGVAIRWRAPGVEFTGAVRYCEYREIGYFVGVELDSGSKWSRKTFHPQHLLDLKRLLASARKSCAAHHPGRNGGAC
jgi:hypothetical protein